jgi:BolA protein
VTRRERIESLLRATFAPTLLEVVDDSARHAGHAGARPGGETHYRVIVVSERFHGLSRVECQRLVYAALEDELRGGLHALQLSARAPER